MNRLNEGAIELNDNEVFNNCSYSCYANIADALNILKAYEDTDLEPEQVKQLNDAFKNSQKKLEKAFDDLLEYKKLEEQGLLVKLPCKVDDEVIIVFNEYGELFITNGWIVTEITITDNDVIFNFRCYETNDEEERSLKDFGKTVFLTREEAEKALKEMEE